MGLGKWWEHSIFNKAIAFSPKLLYHGTTLSYYEKDKDQEYFKHASDEGGVWFTNNPKDSVRWAVDFGLKFRDKPVLVIINAKKLINLRRNWLFKYEGVWRPPYYRADNIKRKCAVMVELKFKENEKYNKKWGTLLPDCKREIARAQAKALRLR
jgi:hypothetical protein